MMLWIAFAVMIAGTLALMLMPLLRRPSSVAARFDHDLAVWRDQLAEIEREQARGLLTHAQAGQARLEIERRILSASEQRQTGFVAPPVRVARRRALIAAGLIIIIGPIGALVLYTAIGRPDLPDRPFAERSNDPDYKAERLADTLEVQLSGHPSATGYALLGRVLTSLGRYDESVDAWRQAILTGDNDAEAYASLGEAVTFANRGQVVTDARAAFREALKITPGDPRARFYIGLSKAQDGDSKDALAIWRDLDTDTPPNAPWRAMLQHQMAMVAMDSGLDPAKIAPQKP